MARKTFKKNDRFDVLVDILVGMPVDFNPDSSSLRGRVVSEPVMRGNTRVDIEVGQLDGDALNAFMADLDNIQYVVYSYHTPIAWRAYAPNTPVYGSSGKRVGYSDMKWVMPDAKYSRTTSAHQGRVAAALSQISGGI